MRWPAAPPLTTGSRPSLPSPCNPHPLRNSAPHRPATPTPPNSPRTTTHAPLRTTAQSAHRSPPSQPTPRTVVTSTPPHPDDHPAPAATYPPTSVPRQQHAPSHREQLGGATTDLVQHPDPSTAAQAATIENLLRCWARETNLSAPDDGTLRIPLLTIGTTLLVPVHYWSPTGWHRFGLPYLSTPSPHTGPTSLPPLDATTLAALLAREAQATAPAPADPPVRSAEAAPMSEPAAAAGGPTTAAGGRTTAAGGLTAASDLVSRVADSLRRTATFITDRRRDPADGPDLFLSAEQALLLGHPLHPTPKSREGLTESEAHLYSPELRGRFPLHWLAVAPSVLATDSAWTERGRTVPATLLTARLAGPELPLPDTCTALPLHPWQLREVLQRPDTAALLDAGLLRDLGPHGPMWHPTSSVRTVYRPGAPAMLKLSLALRITNSRREHLRKELHRGVEVHRLLRSGLSHQWRAVHPTFDIVRDPAWLAVDGLDGHPVHGLDVVIRHNPFHPSDDVSCIAGLVAPRPLDPTLQSITEPAGRPTTGTTTPTPTPTYRSRLADVITRLAARTGHPRSTVAAEWFLRYLEHVVRPVLWLDAEAGIALEAHQQNTLLLLDQEGWPAGGRYRDNQGYYFRESRRADLDARLPGIGEHSDTFVSDEVADERFTYYLAINNVLGLIGAFGSQRLADERLLLAAFRRFLEDVSSGPARLRTALPALLLDTPVLRCKANLLTRLHGLDELVGPVDTQSVYVTITNPLHT
ncbi:IucA/IucC family protein [Streptomyces sp. NPDC059477]|uniref:IucA/IucC family protein n=1 Tax=Streptomyces sp. NPDC059477 TaxID=3346847 RepID=UPI003684114C